MDTKWVRVRVGMIHVQVWNGTLLFELMFLIGIGKRLRGPDMAGIWVWGYPRWLPSRPSLKWCTREEEEE
jgi:hypothetical protein